jgi:hypothetical protein
MSNRRLTRTESSRRLTCLEAIDAGFNFGSQCNGCDYYVANRPLNSLAMKKPRSQLSRYWQCTKAHIYGELSSTSQTNMPYQPVQVTRYNSLLVSSREASIDEMSSTKRVRLFSPMPTRNSSDISASGAQTPAMEKYLLESLLEKSVRECNQATTERNEAIAECNAALAKAEESRAELNRAAELHDQASRCQQMAAVELYKALCALYKCDEAMKKYHSSQIYLIRKEVQGWNPGISEA